MWEDWYRSASPEQQAEILGLARRQGLLYAQQLPARTNGDGHAPANNDASDLAVLKDLLALRVDNLAAVEISADLAESTSTLCRSKRSLVPWQHLTSAWYRERLEPARRAS